MENQVWGLKSALDTWVDVGNFLADVAGVCEDLEELGFEAYIECDLEDGFILIIRKRRSSDD